MASPTAPASAAPTRRGWLYRRPLWTQIVALTVFVLLLPTVGFLLLNRFGQDLIKAEMQAVRAEAAALAAALEIAAIELDETNRVVLNPARTKELVIAHAASKNRNTRVRVFDAGGQLSFDSDRLTDGILGRIVGGKEFNLSGQRYIRSFVPTLSDYKPYYEIGVQDTRTYPEVVFALNEEALISGVYSDTEAGRFRVIGAANVSSAQAVLGAVLIDHHETGIEVALSRLNQRIALVFLIAFAIAILVALILAALLARPVTRLSRAAQRLAAKEISPAGLPVFPGRQDEIGDLAVSLKDMAGALIERADASDAFAAEVAHELKNPLTSLRSAAETLQIVKDEGKRGKLLAVLAEDTDRLDRLISDISASSRLDAELAREEAGRADLIAVTQGFMAGQGLVDPDGLGAIDLKVRGLETALVKSNEIRLVQLVQNLLSNALSFCPDPSKIDFHISQARPGWVKLVVADQGPGIPADKLETIFKRFFTDREQEFGKHSGLGLSIVQRIAESAGGRIWAENHEGGQGAVFSLELPLQKN